MTGGPRRAADGLWSLDSSGVLVAARQVASPNFDERPSDAQLELLVVHSISLPPGQFGGPGIIELFTNRLDPARHPYYRQIEGLRVSSHFLIRRDGELIQFVPCTKRAWHAGQSLWRGRPRCNDFSIGVELEGTDELSFEELQYVRLAAVARALRARYPIVDCVGHSDIAVPAGRKTDPGPHFDWSRFKELLGGS